MPKLYSPNVVQIALLHKQVITHIILCNNQVACLPAQTVKLGKEFK